MDSPQDLIKALDGYKGGLRRFFRDSGCKHDLCNDTSSPDIILNKLGADANVIAEVMNGANPYAKNLNAYNHIERIDDSSGFINALDDTNNTKALKTIKQGLIKVKKLPTQTSGYSGSGGTKDTGNETEKSTDKSSDQPDSSPFPSQTLPSSSSVLYEDGGCSSKMEPEKTETYDCKNVRVLFINNKFDAVGKSKEVKYTKKKRDGAEVDGEYVTNLFQKTLGMKLEVEENIESDEILGVLKKFKRKCKDEGNDGCIVIISTHGGDEPHSLLMDDLTPINLERDVIQQFGRDKFPEFYEQPGKPKIFLFNACRNETTNIPHLPQFNDEDSSNVKYSDILIVHSTLPYHVSYRGKEVGSCYLKFLHDVYMENNGKKIEIRTLLHKVGRKVAEIMESGNCVQIPETKDRLFDKNFYV